MRDLWSLLLSIEKLECSPTTRSKILRKEEEQQEEEEEEKKLLSGVVIVEHGIIQEIHI